MYVKLPWYIERMYPGSTPHSLGPYVKRGIVGELKAFYYCCCSLAMSGEGERGRDYNLKREGLTKISVHVKSNIVRDDKTNPER